MSDIMSDMSVSTITVRELQKNLKEVLALVGQGYTLKVTRRRRLVAVLGPPDRTADAPWPDLQARTRSVFGHRVLRHSASDAVLEGRGDR
jgi:antitoxin (DNA-binding transcriptional repressor) of toxin-antitoxin stability system